MTMNIDTLDVCCAALELSKTSWVCAFAAPGESKTAVHKIKAGDVERLIGILGDSKIKAERQLSCTRRGLVKAPSSRRRETVISWLPGA